MGHRKQIGRVLSGQMFIYACICVQTGGADQRPRVQLVKGGHTGSVNFGYQNTPNQNWVYNNVR